MALWNFGNLALTIPPTWGLLIKWGEFIFRAECISKKFGVPYLHPQQVTVPCKFDQEP